MKGINASVEFVGKLMIVAFIIGMIVIILMSLLPTSFNLFCERTQYEDINALISDTRSANSVTIRSFNVGECVERIDFQCSVGGSRCYIIKFDGREEINVPLNINENLLEIKGGSSLPSGNHQVKIGPYSIDFGCAGVESPSCPGGQIVCEGNKLICK